MSTRYEQTLHRARTDPEGFWAGAAEAISWHRRWDRVLDDANPPFYRWFAGAEVNTCYNAVDRHVEAGRGGQAALIHDSPVTGTKRTLSYSDLQEQTARLAGVLQDLDVESGDRVLIYMPMVPEAAVAMLACARIGAVHSVVFGGFASRELATRIEDARPKVVLAASCGIETARIVEYKPLLDEAITMSAHKPIATVLLQRPQHAADLGSGDLDWHDAMAAADPVDCVPVRATDPLYILYTSGTTGVPKGVVRDNGGHLVALDWSMGNVYGVSPGEVYWAASDIGWVVGHSYIVYAPLIHGCTTVLYEGKPVGTPDASAFWRVISEHNVSALFTAPTAFRAIKREDPRGELIGKFDLSCLRTLFLAGERADPDTVQWAEDKLAVPVIDHWWQTETGWAIAANCVGLGALPVKHGSPTKVVPGYDVRILDHDDAGTPGSSREVPPGENGAIALRLPLPPGCLPTLWRNDEGYVESYLREYDGYYQTGDAGHLDDDGYLYIMSRTDDLINVAGHRLSTGAMEEILASHRDVAECAVIGVADSLKGQVPLGLAVLYAGSSRTEAEIVPELVQNVRDQLGPVASFKVAAIVERLPKTRSGKVLRGTMRRIADGEPWTVPPTIDDPAILDEIEQTLTELGYPRPATA
ncbi:MAG: propionyl-CoA synthetase [Acidobacteria bacterium]|nr:propionyl-CoA synthetase [Acidobacteriota bacterium]